jgi:hypothetical protein
MIYVVGPVMLFLAEWIPRDAVSTPHATFAGVLK